MASLPVSAGASGGQRAALDSATASGGRETFGWGLPCGRTDGYPMTQGQAATRSAMPSPAPPGRALPAPQDTSSVVRVKGWWSCRLSRGIVRVSGVIVEGAAHRCATACGRPRPSRRRPVVGHDHPAGAGVGTSGGLGGVLGLRGGLRPGFVLVVAHPVGQAMLQLAEQHVGQPAQRRFVPVPGGASTLVVGIVPG
jgi:hypothetical protein